MNLGKKLLKLRKERGSLQEALARRVKTTRQVSSRYTGGAQGGRVIRAIQKWKSCCNCQIYSECP